MYELLTKKTVFFYFFFSFYFHNIYDHLTSSIFITVLSEVGYHLSAVCLFTSIDKSSNTRCSRTYQTTVAFLIII